MNESSKVKALGKTFIYEINYKLSLLQVEEFDNKEVNFEQ